MSYAIAYAIIGAALGGVVFCRNRGRFSAPVDDVFIALGVALVWPAAIVWDAIRAIHDRATIEENDDGK